MNSLYLGVGNVIAGFIGVILTQKDFEFLKFEKLKFMIMGGFCGLFLQLFAIMSLRHEKATTVSMFENLIVVFGFFGDIIFFNVPIDALSVIGAILIVGSCVYMTLQKSSEALAITS